jgi:hypothetical protein
MGRVQGGRPGGILPPFCQWEPIGGMFLESVLEELMDRARECPRPYN